MKKEVSEVLKKEQNNESCIHLYLEECGWCAYEVSAYLLMNLLGGKCIVEKIEQCGSKIVRALMNIELTKTYLFTGKRTYRNDTAISTLNDIAIKLCRQINRALLQ